MTREEVKKEIDAARQEVRLINLAHQNLSGLNLSGLDFRWADFTGADFTGADLTKARLTGARLTGARLSGADLQWADLTRAILTETDLTGADLRLATGNGKEIISYRNYRWHIVMTKDVMAISCEQYTVDEWEKFPDDEIAAMHLDALEWWRQNKDKIIALHKKHFGGAK